MHADCVDEAGPRQIPTFFKIALVAREGALACRRSFCNADGFGHRRRFAEEGAGASSPASCDLDRMLPHRRCPLRNQDNTAFAGGVPVSGEHTDGGRGWLGRVGGGCDYQFWQRFVVGALADYDFASLKGDLAALGPFNVSGQEKMNWAWAAGGRLGYLPWDTLMVYVSGGYTQAHFNGTIFAPTASTAFTTSGTTYFGWFLGSGYEYRVDWLPGLYWRTEYRFNSYNKKDIQLLNFGVVTGDFIHSEKFAQTVTSSLVWRFNWWR